MGSAMSILSGAKVRARRLIRSAVRRIDATVKSSARLRSLVYDDANAEQFTDIYWHELMLADRLRVEAYAKAIARNVGPDDVVLDVGTGTGLLAMLAARQRPRRIHAIDHSDFIGIARRIASHNGFDAITFIRTNSRDFTPPEPVSVVIHDQLGADVFNENIIENMTDLKRRGVLTADCRFLPGRFSLFVEPVSLKAEFQVPFLWERRVEGLDFSLLRDIDVSRYERDEYRSRYTQGVVSHFLGAPSPAFEVDLNRWSCDVPAAVDLTRRVVRGGALDGFAVHFVARFDDETAMDTSPLEPPTHWRNRLFRVPGRDCSPGDEIVYRVNLAQPVYPETWSVEVIEAPPLSRSRAPGAVHDS